MTVVVVLATASDWACSVWCSDSADRDCHSTASWNVWERPVVPGSQPGPEAPGAAVDRPPSHSSSGVAGRVTGVGTVMADLDLTDTEPEAFATRLLATTGSCALAPLVLWLLAAMAGVPVPAAAAIVLVVNRRPCRGRPDRGVTGAPGDRAATTSGRDRSFVDLVVLSLAGASDRRRTALGVTGESGLGRPAHGRALSTARDGGTTPGRHSRPWP